VTRPLAILSGLGLVLLVFFALLAKAEPSTVFYAQTSAGLFVVIVIVVLVASLVTSLYMFFFGRLADRFARKRFSRFIGWKFLRSQREAETLASRLRRSLHALRTRPRRSKFLLVIIGLLLIGLSASLSDPELWNAIAHLLSPSFTTALALVTLVVGGAFLLIGLTGLILPTRKPEPEPRLRQRSAVTLPTFISIVGVAIGLWALIVVLGVMHGLQSDLRDKILRTNAHLVIEPRRSDGVLPDPIAIERTLRAYPGIVEAHAFVRGEVMMSSPSSIAVNVVIKGMTLEALKTSEQLKSSLIAGSIVGLDRPETLLSDMSRFPVDSGKSTFKSLIARDDGTTDDAPAFTFEKQDLLPGILLGAELARQLALEVGDEVQLISPDGDIGPTGLRPKLSRMRVAGVFRTGMYEYDQKLAYTALYAAQRFFDLGRERNMMEARFGDPTQALEDVAALETALSPYPGLALSTFRERNKNLFSALALERIMMFVILGFIIFVASLLIVSSLVMLVVEKVREIAVLKALGASDGAIVGSFMHIGGFIGLFGVLSGVPLGVGTCLALIAQGFTMPREFYISKLPVKLDPFEITIFGLAALGMCLIATLYPSRKASQLRPADGIRNG
jgi:lipoprotein-releasing system permease protein